MSLVPVFYDNQDHNWQPPAKELPREQVRALKIQGRGRFEKCGRIFVLFESSPLHSPAISLQPQPDLKDKGHDGRGSESCRPAEPPAFTRRNGQAVIGLMSRFVMGDPLAVAIIEKWKFAEPVHQGAL